MKWLLICALAILFLASCSKPASHSYAEPTVPSKGNVMQRTTVYPSDCRIEKYTWEGEVPMCFLACRDGGWTLPMHQVHCGLYGVPFTVQ